MTDEKKQPIRQIISQTLEKLFSLHGKTAIVTGGGGTLCSAMAEAYVNCGAKVILWDVRPEALREKQELIAKNTGLSDYIATVQVDLMQEASVQKALEESLQKFGPVHILINGAGGNRGKTSLIEVKKEDFDFVWQLNLLAGCILPTKHIARYWIENKIPGVIINIASMAGYNPLSGVWAYSAAKAAVINQTMAHARELAPYNIRVNAIAPGFFIAEQNRKLLLNDDGSLTQRGKDVLAHTPMKRFGDPSDLIGAVIFLASESARFVTGITLPVDGGYLSHNI
jgi:NAD(P)-dependent dehydrogenase (short-subunit alcohol dehydrogenase family)